MILTSFSCLTSMKTNTETPLTVEMSEETFFLLECSKALAQARNFFRLAVDNRIREFKSDIKVSPDCEKSVLMDIKLTENRSNKFDDSIIDLMETVKMFISESVIRHNIDKGIPEV